MGFAGNTIRQTVDRGGFQLETSHFESKEDEEYHDEWAADFLGGGQELARVDDIKMTRVYAGGVSKKVLPELGIAKKDVIRFLIKNIRESGDKIRGNNNFEPDAEGDWRYEYKVLVKPDEIPVTLGVENIFYKDKKVFVHGFVICPFE